MFKFLAFMFLFGMFGFLLIGVLFGRVIRFFNPNSKVKNNRRTNNNKPNSSRTDTSVKKKFSKNEGEYVSYEEIKDDK